LLCIRWADASFSFTRSQHSTALCCVKGRHGCHLKILMSNQKSDYVYRCVLILILPNFTPIRFEMKEP